MKPFRRVLLGCGRPLRARLGGAARAFGESWGEPNLRRAQLAFGAVLAAEWAFMVALAVVAFREGGAGAVGVVGAVCVTPSAIVVPLAAAWSDRVRRELILIAAGLASALAVGAAAVTVTAGMSLAWTCGLAMATIAALSSVRPAHAGLLPALCSTPQQLTSATVVRGMMDSIGTLCGPALAAAGIAFASPQAVFVAVAAACTCSVLLIARLRYEAPPRAAITRPRVRRELIEGFVVLARHRDAATVIGIAVAQTFTRGCINVLVVVVAIDLLRSGEAAVGVLTTAMGAGAIVGSVGAMLLSSSSALARWEGVGVALWGLPLIGCAAFSYPPAVLAFFAAVGVGNALVDVGLFTLPSRLVSEDVVGRVFGSFESLVAVSVALGSLVTPLLVEALGIRGALFAIGAVAPLCVLAAWPSLTRIDRQVTLRDDEITLLRGVPMLQALALPAIERIAASVQQSVVAAGQPVFDQSDEGDLFYVVASGSAEVRRDGIAIRELGPGDAFGEIALLRDCPRTAAVRALDELHLHAIGRDEFLRAIYGYRAAQTAAEATAQRLLQADAEQSLTHA